MDKVMFSLTSNHKNRTREKSEEVPGALLSHLVTCFLRVSTLRPMLPSLMLPWMLNDTVPNVWSQPSLIAKCSVYRKYRCIKFLLFAFHTLTLSIPMSDILACRQITINYASGNIPRFKLIERGSFKNLI